MNHNIICTTIVIRAYSIEPIEFDNLSDLAYLETNEQAVFDYVITREMEIPYQKAEPLIERLNLDPDWFADEEEEWDEDI